LLSCDPESQLSQNSESQLSQYGLLMAHTKKRILSGLSMLRTQLPSGFISADMRPRAQKLPIIAYTTKTIQILKSGTIEIRNDTVLNGLQIF
jgi:hypothetical protein